jgi:hypothetical protein
VSWTVPLDALSSGSRDWPPRPGDHELVFLPDLTVELRAWPYGTWTRLGIDPQAAAGAVVAAWHGGHVRACDSVGWPPRRPWHWERPAMTYVRAQLCDRLQRRLARAYRQWLHPTSRRRPGDDFL